MNTPRLFRRLSWAAVALSCVSTGVQALSVSRLTPPSELFRTNGASSTPVIARLLQGQRFDLQATLQPDVGGSIASVVFKVDGVAVPGTVSLVTTGLTATLPAGTAVASLRAYSSSTPGLHTLTVTATQADAALVSANGNFEIVNIGSGSNDEVKNIIIFLGDGMGSGHRSAARVVQSGITQGKARTPMAMDTFPYTASVMTASLNSIVTDSAPGMQNYVTGQKAANNQEGVWPDDTLAAFDNPRVEYLSEFLKRKRNTRLGVVTTADVFDATPASMAVHTQARGSGTGIVDQFFDERNRNGLYVLMGGGRKWFLPSPTPCTGSTASCGTAGAAASFNGSARAAASDYVLPADIVSAWGVPAGVIDPARDLISEFQAAGWNYASDASSLSATGSQKPLLGLFALSNMNVAFDKLGKRRATSTVVDDFGFPDQPLLPEMTQKALDVLSDHNNRGFVLLVEGASIDKQAHNMDTERFIVDTIEFDKSIAVAKTFVETHPKTLIIVTADHECGGVSVIGASTKTTADLQARALSGAGTGVGGPREAGVVGTYDAAKFPAYTIAEDGYPQSMDPDFKMLIGYGANADRYEDWLANPLPLRDSQQPGSAVVPLLNHPAGPLNRDVAGGYLVTGQISDAIAAHTGNDIPLSAFGMTADNFHGTIDNTDTFFLLLRAALGGKSVR